MSQFDWPITPKKNETIESPKNKRFYFEVYVDERRTTFAKAYGIIVTCYWELFGNMSGMGTLCCESPPPTQKKKKKVAWKVDCPIGK
jgi:hypothetical protein